MLKTNEGTVDRVVRVIVGVALLVWFFYDNTTGALHYAKLLGLVPLLTGLVGLTLIGSTEIAGIEVDATAVTVGLLAIAAVASATAVVRGPRSGPTAPPD